MDLHSMWSARRCAATTTTVAVVGSRPWQRGAPQCAAGGGGGEGVQRTGENSTARNCLCEGDLTLPGRGCAPPQLSNLPEAGSTAPLTPPTLHNMGGSAPSDAAVGLCIRVAHPAW